MLKFIKNLIRNIKYWITKEHPKPIFDFIWYYFCKPEKYFNHEIQIFAYLLSLLTQKQQNILLYQIISFDRCIHDFNMNTVGMGFLTPYDHYFFNNKTLFLALKLKIYQEDGNPFDCLIYFSQGHVSSFKYSNGFNAINKKNIKIKNIEILENNLIFLDIKKDFVPYDFNKS